MLQERHQVTKLLVSYKSATLKSDKSATSVKSATNGKSATCKSYKSATSGKSATCESYQSATKVQKCHFMMCAGNTLGLKDPVDMAHMLKKRVQENLWQNLQRLWLLYVRSCSTQSGFLTYISMFASGECCC